MNTTHKLDCIMMHFIKDFMIIQLNKAYLCMFFSVAFKNNINVLLIFNSQLSQYLHSITLAMDVLHRFIIYKLCDGYFDLY